jgi:hypothetical protein
MVFGFSWVSFRVNPVDIVKYFGAQVGSAIGVSVSVEPNPFSQLAQQLKEKEIQLQEKEKILAQRETELRDRDFLGGGKIILGLISGLLIILFILILLNFYLDYKRRRK